MVPKTIFATLETGTVALVAGALKKELTVEKKIL